MSDVVELLRKIVAEKGYRFDLAEDAANEIERLRQEVEDLEAQLEALADSCSCGMDGEA